MNIKAIVNRIITGRGIRKITRLWAYPLISRKIQKQLAAIEKYECEHYGRRFQRVSYLRSDFWLKECTPNGAVAHTEGIVDALSMLGYQVDVVSPYPMPFLKTYNTKQICIPDGWLTGISELEEMEYNDQFLSFLKRTLPNPDLVYQRYGRNIYAGLAYARSCGVPFILEYNGSEVWMSRNWGHPLRYERLSGDIESFVLRNADLVVGNAEAFRQELEGKGVRAERILILPNGVNPDRFSPTIDGSLVRERYEVKESDVLVSFVGSFGPWHGAEVLAHSIKKVVSRNTNVKFMFVGEGERLTKVKEIISSNEVEEYSIFTGFVGRDQVSSFLAASDILVSPQVPNPDGTPFFGSPTKLFEYMAMGKTVIASRLDQLAVILEDSKDAVLFDPGNADSLADAILSLVDNKELRMSLGRTAREKVLNEFSWNSHVQSIMTSMTQLV